MQFVGVQTRRRPLLETEGSVRRGQRQIENGLECLFPEHYLRAVEIVDRRQLAPGKSPEQIIGGMARHAGILGVKTGDKLGGNRCFFSTS
jgi:hypothetical protein